MQNGASSEPKVGRLRAAWYVLTGQRVTPQQIVAEWVEYQQIFNDLLERWSAKLAREARAEKDRIKRLAAEPQQPQLVDGAVPSSRKAALRTKLAQMRGLTPGGAVPQPTNEVNDESSA